MDDDDDDAADGGQGWRALGERIGLFVGKKNAFDFFVFSGIRPNLP